jgi:rhamnosyltransferase
MPAPSNSSVSVVIPVLNASAYLPALLDGLFRQKPSSPGEVILVDSHSTDNTREIAARCPGVRVVPIDNFSHGRSRNLGVREARGEFVVLMTQDALPADDAWLARLLDPFADPRVAATYSRQVPREDANPMERFFLQTHFPPGPAIRREKQTDQPMGFLNVFFSNVSAAVRREILLRFPFDEELIMSEDQQFSRDVQQAGYAVVYEPESVVVHSHNYTLPVVVQRYFDSVYSLTKLFPHHDMNVSANMGLSYLRREMRYMVRHHPLHLPYYFLYTCCKAIGTVAGHFADRMPRWMVQRLSLHRYHWQDAK